MAAGWKDANEPGERKRAVRTFRDGHQETWWASEVRAGPYSPERARRALVVTTDPERLPRLGTWYLTTDLSAPGSERAKESELVAPAGLAEVVGPYGLRIWAEQSYKQVKHALGWSDYQVRGDVAIRRHWQLVCCAFSFCWWAWGGEGLGMGAAGDRDRRRHDSGSRGLWDGGGEGEKEERASSSSSSSPAALAASAEAGKGVAGALRDAVAILGGVHRQAPAERVKGAA